MSTHEATQPETPSKQRPNVQQLTLDLHAAQMLEDLQLDAKSLDLLELLIDPENDPTESAKTPIEMLDLLDGLVDFDPYAILEITGRIAQHFERLSGNFAEFGFDLAADADGYHDGYVVRVPMPEQTYLVSVGETKHLDPERYELSGVKAAIHVTREVTNVYRRLRAIADQLHTTTKISEAVNNAATEIQDLTSYDETVADATNLMVNATLHYLDEPGNELADVIEANFSDNEDILDRLRDL